MIKVRNKFLKAREKGPHFSKSQTGGNLENYFIQSQIWKEANRVDFFFFF